MRKWFIAVLVLCTAVWTASAAPVISLDGVFSDWDGMPSYGKRGGYQYFYDQQDHQLYFYAKHMDSSLRLMLKSSAENLTAEIERKDAQVTVSVYGSEGQLLHTSSGQWASGSGVEFSIPLEDLTQGAQWGYEVRFKVQGEKWAVISTANTSPALYLVAVIGAGILLPLLFLLWRKKRRRRA